MYASI
jgi:hypothetical protein